MEKILRRNQNGFRKGCSTIGQILTARRIIEGVKARKILLLTSQRHLTPFTEGRWRKFI